MSNPPSPAAFGPALNRRRFLRLAARLTVLGAGGLLAACQSSPSTAPSSAPAAPPSSGPTSAPAGAAPTSAAPASPAPSPPIPVVPSPAVPSPVAAAPSPSPAASPAAAGPPLAGKPMYQMDPQHTGRSPYNGPRRPVLLRTFATANYPTQDQFPARPDIQSSSTIGPDGTVYIGTFQGNLFALRDPGSGDRLEVAWRFHPTGGTSLHATPAIGRDGTVYLGFGFGAQGQPTSGKLFAVRAPTSGTEAQVAWAVDLDAARPTSSPIIGPDGTIYLVNGSGLLVAVASSGTLRWSAQTGQTLKGSAALGPDGTVYVPSMDGKLYGVAPPSGNGSSGTVRWTFDFGQHLGPTPLVTAEGRVGESGIGSGATPTIAPDGTIYIGANNSNLYAVAPDGSMRWLFEAERELSGIWSAPALSADAGTLYFTANKGGVYAVNRADGRLRWQHPIYGSIYSSPALDARGTLYTGSTAGHLLALEATSGELVFDYDAGQQVWSAPSIRPDGSLVIADRQGRVMLFGPA